MRKKVLDKIKDNFYSPKVGFFEKDLKEYINLLEKISAKKEGAILEETLCRATDRLLKKADKFILSEANKVRVKKHFREILTPWISRGIVVKRGYEKPRGYPGDYCTLEMIYDAKDLSEDVLGRLFDRYLFKDAYVVAVQNRKEKMKALLRDLILKSSASGALRILNVASGGARDIRELLNENPRIFKSRKVDIVMVDQDKEALNFSEKEIRRIGGNVTVSYVQENIANLFRNQVKFKRGLGKFDIIYSIGLIDYISDFLLEEFVRFCFESLASKGKLFLAVKNTKIFKSLASDWFCDWNFYLRDQKDLLALISRSLHGLKFKVKAIKGLDRHISFVSIAKD